MGSFRFLSFSEEHSFFRIRSAKSPARQILRGDFRGQGVAVNKYQDNTLIFCFSYSPLLRYSMFDIFPIPLPYSRSSEFGINLMCPQRMQHVPVWPLPLSFSGGKCCFPQRMGLRCLLSLSIRNLWEERSEDAGWDRAKDRFPD